MGYLQVMNNEEFGEVRFVEIDGKPYAVGIDVARALWYANPGKAVIDHCKGITKTGIPTQNQYGAEVMTEMNCIPESDMYRLIIKASDHSKSDEIRKKALRFEHWVFDKVIPSIRQHGAYMTPQMAEKVLNDPDVIIQLATMVKESRAKEQLEREKRIELEAKVEEDKPKVTFADEVANSKGSIPIATFAKILYDEDGINMGRNKLFDWLRLHGYIQQDSREPYQRWINEGYFRVIETSKYGRVYSVTQITGRGQLKLHAEIKSEYQRGNSA